MRKYIIILLLILTSCASRKVNIDKISIKKDSVVETKVETVTNEIKKVEDTTNITTIEDTCEITIIPIDSSKEMLVNGKSYKNVSLKIKKNKVNTVFKNRKTDVYIKRKDSISTIKAQETTTTLGKIKKIEKKENYWLIVYWFILILIIYLLWRNKQKILNLL
jgi:hypothetical protein